MHRLPCCRTAMIGTVYGLCILTAMAAGPRAATAAGPAANAASAAAKSEPQTMRVYIGTFTRTTSKGIYLFDLDLATGDLKPLGLAVEASNPSFLALHPTRPFLYSVEVRPGTGGGDSTGWVTAYAIDPPSGKLTRLNSQPSGGRSPCYVSVDGSGRCAVVSNYITGTAASLPIHDDGQLGAPVSVVQHHGSSVNPERQEAPHAHQARIGPDDRFAFIPDLGIDKVMIYRLDPAAATLTPNDPPFAVLPPGAGPRHMAFHPSARWAYVLAELKNTINVFDYDAEHGKLTLKQTVSTLPDDFQGVDTAAEVVVHPSGRFLYSSNRGHNSIAIFKIADDGTLTPIGHEPTQGQSPRNFNLDPTGRFLLAANAESNNVVVFRVDAATGKLTPTGAKVEVPSAVCVRMQPAP